MTPSLTVGLLPLLNQSCPIRVRFGLVEENLYTSPADDKMAAMIPRGTAVLILITLALNVVSAAGDPLSPRRFGFRVWQVKDGLPQNQVRAVRQTRDNYLWVATYDGLARFDGMSFVVFNRQNTPALRSNIFTALFEDRAGALWIGSDGGLFRYQHGRFATFTTAQGLAADTVTGIAEAPDGALLVATGNALNIMRGETFSRLSEPTLPADRSIRQICSARSGDIWLATNAGAYQIHGRQVKQYTARDGLSSENLHSVIEDQSGNIWFGTIGQGAIRWGQGQFESYPLDPGKPGNIVYALMADSAGGLWAGTHGGLYQFGSGKFVRYTRSDGLPSDFVTALGSDHEGNLWVGTDGGGITRVREAGVRVFTTRDGLAGDFVRSVVEDDRGAIWIGSWFSDSVSLLRDGRFSAVGKSEPLLNGGIRAMLVDRSGRLWLAVGGNRLVSLQQGRFKDHTGDQHAQPIFALAEDELGQLWLGRSDGLFRLQESGLIREAAGLNLPLPSVRIIIKSRNGGLWAGTESGLLRYRAGSTRSYTERDGLPYPFVSGLYEDEDGVLWVGTRGGGLCRLKDEVFTTFTTRDGLPSDSIYQILEDDQGNLWCGSSRGVFRVSRRELSQVAADGVRTLRSVSYGHAELMQNSVHFGTHPSACRTRDGRLWFPTMNGVVMVEPEKLRLNTVAPLVAIERVTVDKESFGGADQIIAPPGRGEVEVQYTAPSFITPERVSFRYRLEGYEPDWVDAGTRRTAFYTNLPPGEYSFRVLAGNNDGLWNETGAAVRFRLRAHFYQTWWFYTVCALTLAGLTWLIHRQRTRQIRARHAAVMGERNRIARDIHDTLAQEVAGLLAQLHVVKTLMPVSPQSAGRHLERAVEMARTGLADARRLVLDLRHQALEHDDLATALENFIAQISSQTASSDAPEVSYQVKGDSRRLAEGEENNLLRIGQESVTNALRHAGAGLIEVSLSFEPRHVELCVRDDGRGFDAELHSQGFGGHYGLLGIRERAAQIGGELSIISAPGAGAEIRVRVKTVNLP